MPDPAQVQPGDRESGRIGAYETQHFVFWYGTNPQGESYAWVRASGQDWPTFLKRAGDWAEWVWRMSRDLTGAPMPYADSPAGERRRIAIYLYGTGRPHVDGGDLTVHGANASPSVWISAQDMAFGSKTFAHEFGHVIQFYSGGFRGGTTAGPVWESVANWLGHLLVPGKTTWISHYGNHLNLGPVWPVRAMAPIRSSTCCSRTRGRGRWSGRRGATIALAHRRRGGGFPAGGRAAGAVFGCVPPGDAIVRR